MVEHSEGTEDADEWEGDFLFDPQLSDTEAEPEPAVKAKSEDVPALSKDDEGAEDWDSELPAECERDDEADDDEASQTGSSTLSSSTNLKHLFGRSKHAPTTTKQFESLLETLEVDGRGTPPSISSSRDRVSEDLPRPPALFSSLQQMSLRVTEDEAARSPSLGLPHAPESAEGMLTWLQSLAAKLRYTVVARFAAPAATAPVGFGSGELESAILRCEMLYCEQHHEESINHLQHIVVQVAPISDVDPASGGNARTNFDRLVSLDVRPHISLPAAPTAARDDAASSTYNPSSSSSARTHAHVCANGRTSSPPSSSSSPSSPPESADPSVLAARSAAALADSRLVQQAERLMRLVAKLSQSTAPGVLSPVHVAGAVRAVAALSERVVAPMQVRGARCEVHDGDRPNRPTPTTEQPNRPLAWSWHSFAPPPSSGSQRVGFTMQACRVASRAPLPPTVNRSQRAWLQLHLYEGLAHLRLALLLDALSPLSAADGVPRLQRDEWRVVLPHSIRACFARMLSADVCNALRTHSSPVRSSEAVELRHRAHTARGALVAARAMREMREGREGELVSSHAGAGVRGI
jgi:hypothetical protein